MASVLDHTHPSIVQYLGTTLPQKSHAQPYMRATSMELLSNKFKISNLIGRAQFLGPRMTHCTHSHHADPSILLPFLRVLEFEIIPLPGPIQLVSMYISVIVVHKHCNQNWYKVGTLNFRVLVNFHISSKTLA